MIQESPGHVRISLAAAMTLGLKDGRFYRGAVSPCVNLLLNYDAGCAGNCGYCGLSLKRPGGYAEKSFIRVTWDVYELDRVIAQIIANQAGVKRICVSMVTNKRAPRDTIRVLEALRSRLAVPVSVLAAPTVTGPGDLVAMKRYCDRIGIAVDTATPALFESIRGRGVNGPHCWDRYWQVLADAVKTFGRGRVGVHLIVGLGETEEAMIKLIQEAHEQGIETHLFTFFPEPDSVLSRHPVPAIGHYRRVQLARYLINNNLAGAGSFIFDGGRLADFGIAPARLDPVIDSGRPFMTSGCPGDDGEVACNRPYSDSLPGPDIRNFPFQPDDDDIMKIRAELRQ